MTGAGAGAFDAAVAAAISSAIMTVRFAMVDVAMAIGSDDLFFFFFFFYQFESSIGVVQLYLFSCVFFMGFLERVLLLHSFFFYRGLLIKGIV